MDTRDHVNGAHKRHEERLQAIYRGTEFFQTGDDVDELRESDPDLLGELESLGFDPDSLHPEDDLMEIEDSIALAIETEVLVTIWLTFGGPNIYLEARLRDREVTEVRHFAAWGGDTRETRVPEDSALWRYAEHAAELATMD